VEAATPHTSHEHSFRKGWLYPHSPWLTLVSLL
jgi:hypothetical protein